MPVNDAGAGNVKKKKRRKKPTKPKMESDSDSDSDGIDHKTEGIINSIEKSLTFVPDSLSDPDLVIVAIVSGRIMIFRS